MTHQLRLHRNHEHLSQAVAEAVADRLNEAVDARGRGTLVLSGGSTPNRLYGLLAADYADRIPWEKLHLFWGDERYVPHSDDASNFGTAHAHLLDHVPVPAEHVHPFPTDVAPPDAAADAYAVELEAFFGGSPPVFDVVLLGLGDDGHTASLFPGSPALDVDDRWVTTARAPHPPHQRLTLTFPVLDQARNLYFLVSGSKKVDALRCAFGQPSSLSSCPAARLRPTSGNLIWWVDADAAAGL